MTGEWTDALAWLHAHVGDRLMVDLSTGGVCPHGHVHSGEPFAVAIGVLGNADDDGDEFAIGLSTIGAFVRPADVQAVEVRDVSEDVGSSLTILHAGVALRLCRCPDDMADEIGPALLDREQA